MMTKPRAMRDALLEQIWLAMSQDELIYFVTADFGSPVLDKIRDDFPKRFINVGIAEQNLINISTGLALEGFKVFAYAIAPFITMRCFEQIRVNLALLSVVRPLNVNLIGVGAGYSYTVSGPTHQCYEDISLMRSMPNFEILSPSDQTTTEALFSYCCENTRPKYLRLDAQILEPIYEDKSPNLDTGFNILGKGEELCLLATGYMLHVATGIADKLSQDGINAGVIDLVNITHFSEEDLAQHLSNYSKVVTMEEAFSGCGGVDAMLFNFREKFNLDFQILNIGVEGGYKFELGSREELHELVKIGPKAVLQRITDWLKQT